MAACPGSAARNLCRSGKHGRNLHRFVSNRSRVDRSKTTLCTLRQCLQERQRFRAAEPGQAAIGTPRRTAAAGVVERRLMKNTSETVQAWLGDLHVPELKAL